MCLQSILSGNRTNIFTSLFSSLQPQPLPPPPPATIHLHCPQNLTEAPKCPSKPPVSTITLPPIPPPTPPPLPSSSCPSYFRWIHEDLRPWRSTGITKETLETARKEAAFRLVVIDGRAYLDQYRGFWQSRGTLTLWGLLQLLNQYPGRVPDFDIMFNLEDPPTVRAANYKGKQLPPPLFRYCKDDATVDIVFPDWSFWGWYVLIFSTVLGLCWLCKPVYWNFSTCNAWLWRYNSLVSYWLVVQKRTYKIL